MQSQLKSTLEEESSDSSAIPRECVESFLAAGTEEAFSPLCACLSPQMMRYFRMRGCERATAEELTQDVLFTVFRHARTVRDRALFRGWVYRVARNALLQRMRKLRRSIDFLALDGMGPRPPQVAVMPSAPDSEFGELVEMLSPDEREILNLRFVHGLDYVEIAAAMGIPVGTAKWRVFNCKLKLSVQMKTTATLRRKVRP